MKKLLLLAVTIAVMVAGTVFVFADEMDNVPFFDNVKITVDGQEVNMVSDGSTNAEGFLICHLSKPVKKDSVVKLSSAVDPDIPVMWDMWDYVDGGYGEELGGGISLEDTALPLTDTGLIMQVMDESVGRDIMIVLIWDFELDGLEKVIKLIDDLPAIEELSVNDKDAVSAARAAYNELSDEDKAKVTNYSKLEAAEAKLPDLEKAAEFDEAVGTLPDLDILTEADYEKIAALKEKYDALTDDQKKLIKNEDAIKLAFEKLVVKDLKDELDATKEKLVTAEATLKVKSTVIKKVKAKAQKKKTTVTWKSAGSGYKYEVYKSLKVSGGYKKATTSSKAKVVIKKLKSKKTYYVKVRGFKTVNGKTVYTQYSDVVSVKIK